MFTYSVADNTKPALNDAETKPKRQEHHYEKVARENAKGFIAKSGMSQRKVAQLLGMKTYQELNNMLAGRTTILNRIPELAKILKRSEASFFMDAGELSSADPLEEMALNAVRRAKAAGKEKELAGALAMATAMVLGDVPESDYHGLTHPEEIQAPPEQRKTASK